VATNPCIEGLDDPTASNCPIEGSIDLSAPPDSPLGFMSHKSLTQSVEAHSKTKNEIDIDQSDMELEIKPFMSLGQQNLSNLGQ